MTLKILFYFYFIYRFLANLFSIFLFKTLYFQWLHDYLTPLRNNLCYRHIFLGKTLINVTLSIRSMKTPNRLYQLFSYKSLGKRCTFALLGKDKWTNIAEGASDLSLEKFFNSPTLSNILGHVGMERLSN